MAYNVRKIDPLDLQPRKAIGVSLPFTGNAVFNSTYQTKDAIRTNLINFFLTGKRERIFNPDFGAGLRDLLFEQMTQESIDTVKALIEGGLEKYFPRVLPQRILLTPDLENNLINFELDYKIIDTGLQDQLIINFEI
jgi:phage baseplate assembly protein W